MKALIVDEPWMGLILSGSKTWEMRKTACSHRGPIALIRKGSGTVVGVAEVIDSRPPIQSHADYAAAESRHGIPPARQRQAFEDGWRTPWVMRSARRLGRPVPYNHPSGAVIWVNLASDVASAVAAAAGPQPVEEPAPIRTVAPMAQAPLPTRDAAIVVATTPSPPVVSSAAPAPAPTGGERRAIRITNGNIDHGHHKVPLDFFPADVIGGSNKQQAAARTIHVSYSNGLKVDIDIDGKKGFFRNRTGIKDFYAAVGARHHDTLILTKLTPYSYHVEKQKSV